jgi:hypothetical protein
VAERAEQLEPDKSPLNCSESLKLLKSRQIDEVP